MTRTNKNYLVELAYKELFPEREYNMIGKVRYSGKFSSYNANVMMRYSEITFSLSREWEEVSDEIVLGLIQHLMVRVMKAKKHTDKMDLYEIFLKKVHKAVPRKESPLELVESFNRVNDEYLVGMMDMPNLQWGNESFRKLGSYHYGSDQITLSTALRDAKQELLDYVMYHELLHKKHKYKTSGTRNMHHTPAFKKDEARFKDAKLIEKELGQLGKRKKWKWLIDL